jgi:hypothetical protein
VRRQSLLVLLKQETENAPRRPEPAVQKKKARKAANADRLAAAEEELRKLNTLQAVFVEFETRFVSVAKMLDTDRGGQTTIQRLGVKKLFGSF